MISRIITLLLLITSFTWSQSVPESYTHTWWVDGYPYAYHANNQRRPLRVIQTNQYALVLNTETLEIPHLGIIRGNQSYLAAGEDTNHAWKRLPAAKLQIMLTLGGKTYRSVGGSRSYHPQARHQGPRMIESGRHWQRHDIWKLQMLAHGDSTPELLNVTLETAGWSDSLAFNVSIDEANLDGTLSVALHSQGASWISSQPVKGGKGYAALNLTVRGRQFKQVNTLQQRDIQITSPHTDLLSYSPEYQAHRFDIAPIPVQQRTKKHNTRDHLRLLPFTVKNTGQSDTLTKVVFDFPRGSKIKYRHHFPITGVSAILCDAEGRPTGIPLQQSKNWHTDKEHKDVPHDNMWFRAFARIPTPAGSSTTYQVKFVHGMWGTLPAASHAQLSLIGWGVNQLWEQSALGCWGETFCYEPTRAHRDSMITDIRPFFAKRPKQRPWSWTSNVGGGDFFRFERPDGTRIQTQQDKATYLQTGPCLTEAHYTAVMGEEEAIYSVNAQLARTDDMARATYRLKFFVLKDMELSRSAFFQMGADYYNDPSEASFAYGSAQGLSLEGNTSESSHLNRTFALNGPSPWVSLHHNQREGYDERATIGTRGFIIRKWYAKLSGKSRPPHLSLVKSPQGKGKNTQAQLVLPPSITSLKRGDLIETTIEYLIPPTELSEYYGSNAEFQALPPAYFNSWKIIDHEARQHRLQVQPQKGSVRCADSRVIVQAQNNQAQFSINGNQTRYTPITIIGLTAPTIGNLHVNGQPLDQSFFGHDYFQTNHDPETNTWSKTYNVKLSQQGRISITFQ